LFLISNLSSASTDFSIEITPSWNGVFKSNKASEIKVHLLSNESEWVKVQLGAVFQNVNLKANIPSTLNFSYKPQTNSLVSIKVFSTTMVNGVEKTIPLSRSDGINLAIISDGLTIAERQNVKKSLSTLDRVKPFFVSTISMPIYSVGYQTIDIMFLHFDALKQMNEQQTGAFSQYIAECGKVIAVQFPGAIYKKLQKVAGCNAAFTSEVRFPAEITDKLLELLVVNHAILPTQESMEALNALSEKESPYKLLLVFCLVYLLLVLILVYINTNNLVLFILPVLASLLTVTIWLAQVPKYSLTSWVDMDSQNSTAQYVASFKVYGRGRWYNKNKLRLPIEIGFAKPSAVEIEYELANQGNSITAILDLALFSEYQWFWQASTAIDAPVAIKIKEKEVAVRNISENSTSSGFLSWRGNIYKLPSLQSGELWVSEQQAIIKSTGVLIGILQQQSENYDVGLVLPFSTQILPFDTDHKSWLFIHGKQPGLVL